MEREVAVVGWAVLVAVLVAPWFLGEAMVSASNITGNITGKDLTLVSALGDPGMRSPRVRVAVESWDFCNRAGNLSSPFSSGASNTSVSSGASNSTKSPGNSTNAGTLMARSSPRWADCADLECPSPAEACTAVNRVSSLDNTLAVGDVFPGGGFTSYSDPDLYTVEKEKYLGSLCAVDPEPQTWNFWMIMLKNGNFDLKSGLCTLPPVESNLTSLDYMLERFQLPSSDPSRELLNNKAAVSGFPCFGPGCMNQPFVYHNWSRPDVLGLAGGFYGTYDLDKPVDPVGTDSSSFFSVNWYKSETGGSWNFHHVLRVSDKYPWLMLYLRADTTSGLSGGYPWDTRGMMHTIPQTPNFKVMFTLNVLMGGGPHSQFYLLDLGGCWKNNGEQCNGDISTDVTRYTEMIINPDTSAWCAPSTRAICPPYHTFANGTKVSRNDTRNFPFSAYHLYCVPSNAHYAEKPYRVCDPYSNPQPQELLQLLPHPEWAVHGYPASKGEGWVGDGRAWELDAGALSSRLFFYQDPGTPPAIRNWPSIDIGTEIYLSREPDTAEWVVSDFNVLVPST